ncbi:YncE family protein [Methylobacterium sp. C25]|uniref:YncE family protein n=1 Tax=Methylobacterium sp. C25 TaxID=2721622 RepID=UPI003FA370A4
MSTRILLSATLGVLIGGMALAGQVPGPASAPDVPVSHRDRFYTSDQFSNTVSVIDPADNKLLGVIKLGDTTPMNLSPLYKGQLLVHGMGFSPDRKTLLAVSIGSNSVTFIDTATNTVRKTAYVGRSPHEAFFTPDGKAVWVSVRGEDYIAVLDAESGKEAGRITVPNGPGMTIFSPDGRYGYVCSSFSPETVVIDVKTHEIAGRVKQESPFCPDIAATPDGAQVWFTLKDVGKVQVFEAKPPFKPLKTLDTGPITNHVNIVRNKAGQFAYVTIGGENTVKVFRTDDYAQVATIPTGALPHGLWPSGDGSRVYVGLENADKAAVIDTASNTLIAEIPIGQGPQGVAYVPEAVPDGAGAKNLQPLGPAGKSSTLTLAGSDGKPATQVTLFDQGVLQTLQAAVTGLAPKKPFVLALSRDPKGTGTVEPLAGFMTNPAGAAIVNAVGPIRQVTQGASEDGRRYLVIVEGKPGELGQPVQRQSE